MGNCRVPDLGLVLVTEWMEGGSLLDILQSFEIQEKTPLSSKQRIEICIQISIGLEYLHENGIIHRDLAARNCLVIDFVDY